MIQDIAPHKLKNPFDPEAVLEEGCLLLIEQDHKLLLRIQEQDIVLPMYRAEDFKQETEAVYLFRLDKKACFWVSKPGPELIAQMQREGFAFHSLRELRRDGAGSQHRMFAAYTALHLIGWYRDNAYCGRCGTRTEHSGKERALVCPCCGRVIYPRIVPAVIVGVTNGDEIVLTRYAGRDISYYALVAGFTEIGETLEETVAREVMEEVGLRVKNIRYYKSQPWALADDILMGFFCEVDGDTKIQLDTNELKEGVWVKREEIELQPDTYSLTNEMMTMFKLGKV